MVLNPTLEKAAAISLTDMPAAGHLRVFLSDFEFEVTGVAEMLAWTVRADHAVEAQLRAAFGALVLCAFGATLFVCAQRPSAHSAFAEPCSRFGRRRWRPGHGRLYVAAGGAPFFPTRLCQTPCSRQGHPQESRNANAGRANPNEHDHFAYDREKGIRNYHANTSTSVRPSFGRALCCSYSIRQ